MGAPRGRRWSGLLTAALAVVVASQAPAPAAAAPARKLVFQDDFDGTRLDRRAWTPYDGPGHAGRGLRRPSAWALDGRGHLVVTAQMVDGLLVSGGMAHRRDARYGRWEVRVRTEADPTGTMSGVALTWPRSGRWPEDGEIDFYETGAVPGARPTFNSFVHHGARNEQVMVTHRAAATRWHTVAMDWSPSAIRVSVDGVRAWAVTDPAVIPRVAHHLCLQLDPTAKRDLTRPVRMWIDRVRIFR